MWCFGIFNHKDAAVLTQLGLHSLQHRRSRRCWNCFCDKEQFTCIHKTGLVGDNFNNLDIIDQLKGKYAIGHVRYSTSGGSLEENIQPLFANLAAGGFACAHNGNLTNTEFLRKELIKEGAIFQSSSDTEIILQLVAKSRKKYNKENY